MSEPIRRAAVLGAGVMGSGIAAHLAAARGHRRLSHGEAARRHQSRALELSASLGDRARTAATKSDLAMTLISEGDLPAAIELLRTSIAERDDEGGRAVDRLRMGMALRELGAHRRGHVRPETDLRHAEIEQRERDDQRRGVVADRDRDRHASRAAFPHEPCGAALDLRDERAVRHVVGRARDCRRGTRIARVPPQRFARFSITNSTFTANAAAEKGGAIANYYVADKQQDEQHVGQVVNTTFSANVAQEGGAIYFVCKADLARPLSANVEDFVTACKGLKVSSFSADVDE